MEHNNEDLEKSIGELTPTLRRVVNASVDISMNTYPERIDFLHTILGSVANLARC